MWLPEVPQEKLASGEVKLVHWWTARTWWGGKRYTLSSYGRWLEVCCWSDDQSTLHWTRWREFPVAVDPWIEHRRYLVSRYIKQAIESQKEPDEDLPPSDGRWFHERPALLEFMTCRRHEDGTPRELSVVMVCVSDVGMRVGLKDDDAGGWLWREETTVEKALNAIEKALQSGNVKWSVPGGRTGKNGKK